METLTNLTYLLNKGEPEYPNDMEHSVEVVAHKVGFPDEQGMTELIKARGPVAVCIYVHEHIFFYEVNSDELWPEIY